MPGVPQGKARARTFYNPKLGRSQSITPQQTVLYENLIKQCYINACADVRWMDKEPLKVVLTAYFPIPKSMTKKDRERVSSMELFPTKKPDADNIAKVVCDALNGIAYADDTQVITLTVNKRYDLDGEPRISIYIVEWGQDTHVGC